MTNRSSDVFTLGTLKEKLHHFGKRAYGSGRRTKFRVARTELNLSIRVSLAVTDLSIIKKNMWTWQAKAQQSEKNYHFKHYHHYDSTSFRSRHTQAHLHT